MLKARRGGGGVLEMLACVRHSSQSVRKQEGVSGSPVTVMCQCSSAPYLLLTLSLWSKYDPHFVDEESELQRR